MMLKMKLNLIVVLSYQRTDDDGDIYDANGGVDSNSGVDDNVDDVNGGAHDIVDDDHLSEYDRRPRSTRQATARAVKFLVELQMVWQVIVVVVVVFVVKCCCHRCFRC